MTSRTVISLRNGESRAHVDIESSSVVPRLIDRGPDRAHIALVAGQAMLLGGDRIEVSISVGAGCWLELEDIGGTVAYSADGIECSWSAHIELAENATLVWNGLPMIVADGANVVRTVTAGLGSGACMLLRETVVLGRVGEAGGRARLRTSIADGGGPVLDEVLELDALAPVPGVLARNRVLDTVVVVGLRPRIAHDALVLDQPGAIARHLGAHTHTSELGSVWRDWRSEMGGVHARASAHTPVPPEHASREVLT